MAATAGAFAGEVVSVPAPAPCEPSGDWCDALKNIGTVYKNKENPFIQEVKFFGRVHYQWGYTDGRINSQNFHGNGDMLRRLRFGTSVKFLNGFKATARANFVDLPAFRNVGVDYLNFDEINLEYKFGGDILGFEDVTVGYGRYKVAFGGEEHTSSKKIKTIERSELNNRFAPARSTGAKIMADRNDISYTLGVFSTEFDLEDFAGWSQGQAYLASMEFEAGEGDVILDFLYVDADRNEDQTFGYEWAASATYDRDFGSFELFANATFGELHTGNEVYGVVIMPSKELIEDKLEAVLRYQYAHSDGDRISLNSRNTRNVARYEGVGGSNRPGDTLHSVYGGLNYFICDHNMKVMTGVEYQNLDGGLGRSEATTLWAAFRMYF